MDKGRTAAVPWKTREVVGEETKREVDGEETAGAASACRVLFSCCPAPWYACASQGVPHVSGMAPWRGQARAEHERHPGAHGVDGARDDMAHAHDT